ncbi:tripartite tricarboxylate transporter substrate binding protein [Bradyrhizobium jicamae]|uniref:tripartite tricarboxylate transporter substrate binding protein n=1 Tax=Bradyrhizobium jicamae TaxID=280332 RepID=UPI001BA8E9C4|nr:tripartite tricarboxylate transporter substrate binding protein [Bradyrhizobium jicamae]MBR0757860.1 tripartite tricarboxylate transporter substrate binding protein [Bradyrhizobium jicamae]
MNRRDFLRLVGGTTGLIAAARAASAQSAYPNRPVRIIAGFAAGGGVDITARLIGQWLSERLGQPFIVENRTGADGNIATEAVVNAAPDGHMLLLATLPNAVNATLYPNLKFNFLRDMAPVAGVIEVPMVALVHPSFPAKDIAELIAYAKANPGKINMASAGVGSAPHMAGELFMTMTGVTMTHVPYRGQSQAMSDLLSNQVQLLFAAAPGTADYIRSGKLRALGLTSASHAEVLKDLPTVGSTVSGYEASQWYGVAAPAKTPPEIVARLNREINAAFADPAMQSRLAAISGDIIAGSPADFGKLIADETGKWAKVVRQAGLRAE